MSEKPKNGSMQIAGGKMRMYVSDAWVDFGVFYVAADMRKIARPIDNRKNGYASVLIKWAATLEREGMASVKKIQELIKPYFGAREPWMSRDCRIWHGWLQQIYQFRNCTGKKDQPIVAEANRSFRENYEKIFMGDPVGSPQP